MSTPAAPPEFLARLRARDATVGVVGLGYVGLPAVFAFHDAGFRVVGFDIDPEKIALLRQGRPYLKHLGHAPVAAIAASDRFTPTSEPADLAACDAVLVCVPTPLGRHREPDLAYVQNSTRMLAGVLRPGALVVLTSTSYPGTTREVCLPIFEAAGRPLGRPDGVYLAFSPEREDPGRRGVTTRTIPRLVGGCDEPSGQLAHALLSQAIDDVRACPDAETAEAAKILENTYRAVNIALVNELKPVFATMGIDIWQVIDAASTKPFGFQPFYPGPGLGGHCIPIDPFYLTWKARELGHATRFIELAGEINSAMPHKVVDAVADALNADGIAMNGADILVIGLAYKPDIDDVRETPAAEILALLAQRGAKVAYHDPHVPVFRPMRRHRPDLSSQPLTPDRLARTNAVVIVTDHAAVDYALLGRHARLIVDTRNAMARRAKGPVAARVVKA